MKVKVYKTSNEAGFAAAQQAAEAINKSIHTNGSARILLSTGASQFPFFENFIKQDIDWSKVEMFHLDEYVGISKDHIASFNRYLRERFVDKVHPAVYHLIDGQADTSKTIKELTALLNERPVDVGLIGIGENAHIAFNDPPADFNDERAYKVVNLSDTCIAQQLHEGWFDSKETAFKQAISMTCKRIMQCKTIICVVPYKVKADAVYNTLTSDITPDVPATLLKKHADTTLYLDVDSAGKLTSEILERFV